MDKISLFTHAVNKIIEKEDKEFLKDPSMFFAIAFDYVGNNCPEFLNLLCTIINYDLYDYLYDSYYEKDKIAISNNLSTIATQLHTLSNEDTDHIQSFIKAICMGLSFDPQLLKLSNSQTINKNQGDENSGSKIDTESNDNNANSNTSSTEKRPNSKAPAFLIIPVILVLVIGGTFLFGRPLNQDDNPSDTTSPEMLFRQVFYQYTDFIDQGITDVDNQNLSRYPYVSHTIFDQFNEAYNYNPSIYYCFNDIDSNGVPELLVSIYYYDTYEIIDIFAFNGSEIVNIYNQMPESYDDPEHLVFKSVYENGIIGLTEGYMASAVSWDRYYKLSEDGYSLELIEGIHFDRGDTYLITPTGEEYISGDRADELYEKYEQSREQDFSWTQITENVSSESMSDRNDSYVETSFDTSVYDELIEEYCDEHYRENRSGNVFYAFMDIDHNGIDELLLNSGDADYYNFIPNLYTCDSGNIIPIIDEHDYYNDVGEEYLEYPDVIVSIHSDGKIFINSYQSIDAFIFSETTLSVTDHKLHSVVSYMGLWSTESNSWSYYINDQDDYYDLKATYFNSLLHDYPNTQPPGRLVSNEQFDQWMSEADQTVYIDWINR